MNTVREWRGGHRNPDFGGKGWSSPCDPHGGPTQTCRIRTWVLRRPKDDSWACEFEKEPLEITEMIHKMNVEGWMASQVGSHGGNSKVMALWKEIYSGNDTMVSLCIRYIKSPVVHGSDEWRDCKGWQSRLGDGGQDCGALLSRWKVWFFSQYIYFIEV